jgi:hypothetical protein
MNLKKLNANVEKKLSLVAKAPKTVSYGKYRIQTREIVAVSPSYWSVNISGSFTGPQSTDAHQLDGKKFSSESDAINAAEKIIDRF